MCGITAIISKNQDAISADLIQAMTDIIDYRGPDGYGYYFGANFALGHRRLAIIDLSVDGHQPMNRHGYTITFNGEIFNYIELKEQLIELGYHFETDTDTEVILVAYKHWGEECQNRFIGMWAFVLFDPARDILFCSRDRFYQKPFHYTTCGEHFMMGSEIKQFTVHPAFKPSLNLNTTFDFLEKGLLNHDENTFFNNVYSLDGGHQLVYDLNNHEYKITKWYHPIYDELKHLSFQDATNMYRFLLKDSVKMRMRSDVTVGVALSGGLDSSGITGIAHDLDEDGKYCAISSCYNDQRYDERYYADCVATKTGFQLTKTFPELSDLVSKGILDKMVWHHEQPIPTASHFSEYSVFETAKKQDITVMLCGQGPDEHSAGYSSFFSYHYLHLFKGFQWGSLINAMRKHKDGFFLTFKQFIGFLFLNRWKSRPGKVLNYTLFHKEPFRPLYGMTSKIDSIRKYSLEQIFKTSIPYQAHSEDRNSMIFSIESRSPYLDHRLVEFAVSLPDDFKMKANTNKWILREALKPYLPEEVYQRKDKMGFVAPDAVWILEDSVILKPILEEAINSLNGLINKGLVDEYDEFVKGKRPFSWMYFRIIGLASLCRQYKMDINT